MVFPVVMYGCESRTIKKAEAPKNGCFWTVVLEKTLESPLDCKEIKPVNPKENQSSIFTGRTDAKAPLVWPPDEKSWLLRKDPDAGKDWRREEKGTTEDEMVGWHHRLKGHEWASSGGWWWTGRPGVLQSMGLQRVVRVWAIELILPSQHLPPSLLPACSVPSLGDMCCPSYWVGSLGARPAISFVRPSAEWKCRTPCGVKCGDKLWHPYFLSGSCETRRTPCLPPDWRTQGWLLLTLPHVSRLWFGVRENGAPSAPPPPARFC